MNVVVSILFDGVAYAMILYVISVGLSVTLGLMGFANLAHGAFAMIGGYALTGLMNRWGVPFLPAVGVTFLIVGAIGAVLERAVYRRLYGAGELDQVMLTIGLVFMSMALVSFVYGPQPQPVRLPAWLTGQIEVLGRKFPTYRVFLIGAGGTIILGLWLGLERTRFGTRVRAAVDSRRMAEAVGIDVDRLFTATFALGTGLAGVGGALGADILAPTPTYAIQHLVFFLIVVAVGGLGSLKGAFVAALLLGIVDNGGKYLFPEFGAFFIYAAMMALLLWRPAGLFGRRA